MHHGTATMENSMAVAQKLKLKLPCAPAIPLLGVYPKEMKTETQRNIYTTMFAALFTIAKKENQPKYSLTR